MSHSCFIHSSMRETLAASKECMCPYVHCSVIYLYLLDQSTTTFKHERKWTMVQRVKIIQLSYRKHIEKKAQPLNSSVCISTSGFHTDSSIFWLNLNNHVVNILLKISLKRQHSRECIPEKCISLCSFSVSISHYRAQQSNQPKTEVVKQTENWTTKIKPLTTSSPWRRDKAEIGLYQILMKTAQHCSPGLYGGYSTLQPKPLLVHSALILSNISQLRV